MLYRGKEILVLFLGFLPLFSAAQNLVPNSGFEEHSTCIDPNPNQSFQNCDDWFNAVQPLSTFDWYSTCYPSSSFYQLPNLFYGFSFPHTGEAMVGFVPYSSFTNIGEAIGVRLSNPLIGDSAYCFSFWIKNSENHGNVYSMREYDIAFLVDTTGIHSNDAISSYITVSNTPDLGDWNLLSGYYIAGGGEEFMLIGSFNSSPDYYMKDPETTPENCLYYYYDDFSVTPCNKDSILSVVLELPNVFTPNGDLDNDSFKIKNLNIASMHIQIFNRWGNLVADYEGLAKEWVGTDQQGALVSEGVYFVKVIAQTTFGEIITRYGDVQLFR